MSKCTWTESTCADRIDRSCNALARDPGGRLGAQGTFFKNFFRVPESLYVLVSQVLTPPAYTKGRKTASGPLGGDLSLDKSEEKALI